VPAVPVPPHPPQPVHLARRPASLVASSATTRRRGVSVKVIPHQPAVRMWRAVANERLQPVHVDFWPGNARSGRSCSDQLHRCSLVLLQGVQTRTVWCEEELQTLFGWQYMDVDASQCIAGAGEQPIESRSCSNPDCGTREPTFVPTFRPSAAPKTHLVWPAIPPPPPPLPPSRRFLLVRRRRSILRVSKRCIAHLICDGV
jgi:hypothetical protein